MAKPPELMRNKYTLGKSKPSPKATEGGSAGSDDTPVGHICLFFQPGRSVTLLRPVSVSSCLWQIPRRAWWRKRREPIFIHPGSGGLKKVWPLKRWWSLLGWLFRIKAGPVIVITGPADAALREFPQAARRWGCHHLEQPSLVRLAAFLGESRFYCGNDSGASHLAAVVGAPSIVIFGPTNPEVWAPEGPMSGSSRTTGRKRKFWTGARPRSLRTRPRP